MLLEVVMLNKLSIMGTFKFLLIPEERTSGNRVSFQSISFKFALLINEGTRDGIHGIDLVREYVV